MSFSILVISFIILFIQYGYSFQYPNNTDFTEYRNQITRIIRNTQVIPDITPDTTPTDCEMPKNSIMVTYLSSYLKDFLLYQRKAMEIWKMRSCLERRLLTVCLDEMCLELCDLFQIENCMLLNMNFPASNFKESAYEAFTFVKHELLAEALKVVDYYFMFDIDVLLFKNPWVNAMYDSNKTLEKYIFRAQAEIMSKELSTCEGEGSHVNSGQIYIKNSPQAKEYANAMLLMKDEIVVKKSDLDQEFILPILKKLNMPFCQLYIELFNTYCWDDGQGFSMNAKESSKIITWHANCSGNRHEKTRAILKFLSLFKQDKLLSNRLSIDI